jgi:hypothetical protein
MTTNQITTAAIVVVGLLFCLWIIFFAEKPQGITKEQMERHKHRNKLLNEIIDEYEAKNKNNSFPTTNRKYK